MRNFLPDKLEHSRLRGDAGCPNGAYSIKHGNSRLGVIASNGDGWDHVSVSLKTRCPTWEEMCFIKDLFFDEEEAVMQLHPKKSEYVNNHQFCLHLWRPQTITEMQSIKTEWESWGEEYPYDIRPIGEIPLPPTYMVGTKIKGMPCPPK